MADGSVVTYHIDVEMPHPCFEAAMDNLDNFVCGYKAKHAKK